MHFLSVSSLNFLKDWAYWDSNLTKMLNFKPVTVEICRVVHGQKSFCRIMAPGECWEGCLMEINSKEPKRAN